MEGEIACRPDIRPPKGHDEVDVCRPGADTANPQECLSGVSVAHPRQGRKGKLPGPDPFGQAMGIARLLPGEAQAPEAQGSEGQH